MAIVYTATDTNKIVNINNSDRVLSERISH